jgi:hypothetical protein
MRPANNWETQAEGDRIAGVLKAQRMARLYLTLIVTVGFLLSMEATAPAATSEPVEAEGIKSSAGSHHRDHRFEIKLAKKPVKTRSSRTKKALPKCVTAEELARKNLIESGVLPRVLQSCR